MQGIKHLVACRCILSQFKRVPDPPQHRFVVFSIIDDDDVVRPKLVCCNNCGVVHKVSNLTRSEILPGKEDIKSVVTIDDIKVSLPDKLVGVLESHSADLASWEAAQFIVENKRWGEFIVLSTEVEEGVRHGKLIQILGENMFKVEQFERQEEV